MRCGGADNITVGDLAGTGVKQVADRSRRRPGAAGDGAADTVTVNGTNGGQHDRGHVRHAARPSR